LIVVIGLAVGGFFGWKKYAAKAAADSAAAKQPATALVESRSIIFAVNVAGEIAPAEQVSVRPEINGLIATLAVDVGDRVKKGIPLFTLDDKELQNTKASKVTEIDRAKVQLEQAERNYKRYEQLSKEKVVSQELFDDSRTQLELARNALERSQKELALIEERLTKTVILAPFDCTILVRPVSIGQAVAGAGGMSGGTEVLSIADLNNMVINAHVNQADITRLKMDQEVQVAVEAVPGLKVKGIVNRIAPQATVKSNIKGFSVRVAIKDIDPRVQPGMTANVTIPVASAENVLGVPLAAVYTDTLEGERYVYIKEGDTFVKRTVKIGIADYFHAEVLDGLKSGDVVALEPPATELANKALPGVRPGAVNSAKAKEGAPAKTKGDRPKKSGDTKRPAPAGGS
jgi:RND family efflux transporter MFP subunit